MRNVAVLLLLLAAYPCQAQTGPQNISPAQLQALLDLPLDKAVQRRNVIKEPLKTVYARQTALAGKDCQTEIAQGQQSYNICMGQAEEQLEKDYATFYNNLQMLCHDQNQLRTLQSFEARWVAYREHTMKAAKASWPDGTGAPGFASQVYLSLVRNHMRELRTIYDLNISQ